MNEKKTNRDDDRRQTRSHRPEHPGAARFSFLGFILVVVMLVPPGYAEEIVPIVTDPIVIVDPIVIDPNPIGFPISCLCRDLSEHGGFGTSSADVCPTACSAYGGWGPIVIRGCSGVSVDGTHALTGPDRIVQCGSDALFQGGLGATEQTVLDDLIPREKSAVDTVLGAHLLPEADRGNVMGFARDSVRAFLYADLLGIIKRPDPRTTSEQGIVGAYAEQVRLKRLDAAEFALSEFHRWESVVCANFGTGYVPPLGFTYPSQGGACTQIGQTFGGPQPPSSKEFIAYGTAHAYNKISTDAQAATVAVRTAQGIAFGGVLAAAAATGIAAALVVVFTSIGPIIITAILPFAFVPVGGFASVALAAAGAASATGTVVVTSAIAIGGAVAVVIAAIAIAVLQGIAVFEAAAIPGTLEAQVTAAQTAPDLRVSITTPEGQRELYGVFIESTVPDYAATSAPPAPIASDRRFRVKNESRANLGVFPSIDLQSPALPGINWETRLSGGWFVPRHVLADDSVLESLSLSLQYFDWNGNKRLASRRGNQFVLTSLDATSIANAEVISDEIQYKDWDGTKLIASIAVDDTPPVITPQVTGTLGHNGWYTSNVHVAWSVLDSESAIGSRTGCDSVSIGSSGTTSYTCTAVSEGGTGTGSVTVKTDLTLPTIEGSRTPAANANGWNNANVTASFGCNDTPSGVASCTGPQTLSGEGANQSVNGSVADIAGNTANASIGNISIDKTAPGIQGSRTPAANASGWNNTDVTVSFDCSDGLSGVASCTSPQTLSANGANQSVSGSATDRAGNTANTTVSGISIDKTPPTCTATASPNTLWPPNGKPANITASVSVQDAGSGPTGYTLVAVSSNEPEAGAIAGWSPETADTSGQLRAARWDEGKGRIYTLTYQAKDTAGNTASCSATVTVPHDHGGMKK